ncbi:MAG: DUF3039 domain-containing protein [Actinobacteria bacterium]|nr:DUF3039 domain-containing protein [Actinomycetota bacterium]
MPASRPAVRSEYLGGVAHPSQQPRTITKERVDERTHPVTGDGDHDRFAHIVKKDDQMRGYVLGETVTALCGKRWIPSRDPSRYPICPTCKELLALVRSGGGHGGDGGDGDGTGPGE